MKESGRLRRFGRRSRSPIEKSCPTPPDWALSRNGDAKSKALRH